MSDLIFAVYRERDSGVVTWGIIDELPDMDYYDLLLVTKDEKAIKRKYEEESNVGDTMSTFLSNLEEGTGYSPPKEIHPAIRRMLS